MDKANFLKTVKLNYKLDINLIPVIDEMLINANIRDFTQLLTFILKSNKFSFLDRLQEAIDIIPNSNDFLDNKTEIYCKKLIDKIRGISRVVDESLPVGLRYNDFAETATFDNFKSKTDNKCAFDEKEQRLLNEVGSCKIWLTTFDDHEFLLKLMKALKKLHQLHLAPPKEKVLTLEDIKNRKKDER
jgi:hypothetical protein